jgi:hypothetical protein
MSDLLWRIVPLALLTFLAFGIAWEIRRRK